MSPAPDRRSMILEAAFNTFCRYGYRKTSMEDVARAAEISRQALYGYFPDRDALFRECIKNDLEAGIAAAGQALVGKRPIAERLAAAFDEFVGRNVEKMGTDFHDLGEGGRAVLGTLFYDYGHAFEKKITHAIADSTLAAKCKKADVTPEQMAQTLNACSKGWKMRAKTRAAFVAAMDVAVRLVCS